MYDVIVVGAGPAGATAARHCAAHGLRTLLIEKERTPRDKPCAGGVTLAAARELDFPIPESVIERRCHGFRITYGSITTTVSRSETVTYTVNRRTFDALLIQKAVEAGAEVREEEECLQVQTAGDGVKVKTTRSNLKAGIVIGADGFYSKVLRSLFGGFDRSETRFCVTSEIPLSEEEISERMGDFVTFHFGLVPMGYAWLFPKKDNVSAGIGCGFPKSRDLPSRFREFLALHDLPTDLTSRGCFIPVSRFRRKVYTDRVMLCGDAAGFVDSFSGEGIRFAIASGRLAALTAASAFEKGDFSAQTLRAYQEECLGTFGTDLECAGRMSDRLFRHPRLILSTAMRSEKAMHQYLKTITGDIRLREFSRWLKKRALFYLSRRLILPVQWQRTPQPPRPLHHP